MVLQDLGGKLTQALHKLNTAGVIDTELIESILKEIQLALLQSDVNARLVKNLKENVLKAASAEENQSTGVNKSKIIRKAVFNELVSMLSPGKKAYEPKKGMANIYMFVGLQGAGKTTTIAKFANTWARKGWKTCMVCADTFRAGAYDQLKQNATKIRVPFYGSYTEADPVKIAEEGVDQFTKQGYEIIIVDTSGRHKQEDDLFEEMEQVKAAIEPDEVVFVMDSTIGQAVEEQAMAFKASVPVGSVIITKMDGHAKGGGAISAVAATASPITFIGTGEHFDEFEKFEPQSFVSRLLGMGDIKGLFETIGEKTDLLEKAPEMMQKFQKGVFTLGDLREQFQSLLKMGNFSQVVSMIPGMQFLTQGKEKDGVKRIQMFMTAMDSMTEDELDGIFKSRKRGKDGKSWVWVDEKSMSAQRIVRIAKGSGTSIGLIVTLLRCHKQFEKMVGKMGKSGLMKGNNEQMQQQMQRNPNAVMQQLGRSIDPRMMQQMGGMQNMMKMMKEMQDMPGGLGGLGGMGGALGGMGGGGGGAKRGKKGKRR